MDTAYPALKAKFGSTEYFLTAMSVRELVAKVVFPDLLPGWEERTIEEKFQRKLDMGRIRREIAPYFATDEKRFSGSLVLAILNHDRVEMESIERMGMDNIPKLYSGMSNDMGFLVLPDDAMLVPLDGQHRAKAFQIAMKGYNDPSGRIPVIRASADLGEDKVAVILVRFEDSTSRYIFNKINRYAKPTTKADKLITDDDDAMAVITRKLLTEGVFPERLVNTDTNSLNRGSPEFTTLSTLYECNYNLLRTSKIPSMGNPRNMPPSEMESRLIEIKSEWNTLKSKISLWKQALADPMEKGDDVRRKLRSKHLLCKPIGQRTLVGAYAHAYWSNNGTVSKDTLIRKLDDVDWKVTQSMWSNVLVNQNDRIMSGNPTVKNAIMFVAHLIGAKLSREEEEDILEKIYGSKSKRRSLPDPIT